MHYNAYYVNRSVIMDSAMAQIPCSTEHIYSFNTNNVLKSLYVVCTLTVMGHVVSCAMQLIGLSKTARVDLGLRQSLDELSELTAKSTDLTDREQLHVKAIQQFADGYQTPLLCNCNLWRRLTRVALL